MANPFLNEPTYVNQDGSRINDSSASSSSGGATKRRKKRDPRDRGNDPRERDRGAAFNRAQPQSWQEAADPRNNQGNNGEAGPDKLTANRFSQYNAQDNTGYYDPQFENNPNRGAQNTGFGKFYFEQNPQAGFDWFMNNRVGLNPRGEDAIPDYFDSFLQDQYGQAQADFQTALQDRTNLKWRRFLEENLSGTPPPGTPGVPGPGGQGHQPGGGGPDPGPYYGSLSADQLRRTAYSVDPRERGELGGPASSRWVPF